LFLVAFARKPWLSGWVPEPKSKDFCEPMQEAFIQKDAPDGVMGKISSLRH
jgi:hypothetical protein